MHGELCAREDSNAAAQLSVVTKSTTAFNELLQKLPQDDASKERRATALNNWAWTMAWQGGYATNESQYNAAVNRFTEALKLYPDDYVLNRNMAVVLKRYRKTPSDPA